MPIAKSFSDLVCVCRRRRQHTIASPTFRKVIVTNTLSDPVVGSQTKACSHSNA